MGIPNCDAADIHALQRLIQEGLLAEDVACSMVSPMLGIASGSNSGYGLLAALYSMLHQEVIGMPDDLPELKSDIASHYRKTNEKKGIRNVCLSTMALGGTYSSIILEKN